MRCVPVLLLLVLVTGCPSSPVTTTFRCDPVTGSDCDAGTPAPDIAGRWTMKVTLEQPDAGEGGRTFQALSAKLENVLLVKADGGWRVEIPGEGDLCCAPAPFISDGLALNTQAFTVRQGTPMEIEIAGGNSGPYRALGPWQIELDGPSPGLLSPGLLRFERRTGRVFDYEGASPIHYVHSVEFSR
jgi:hypothetical protein